jgi:peptidoglycan/LPS O-acetylase OafA/YrhL
MPFFKAVAFLTAQLLSRQLPVFGTAPLSETPKIMKILSAMGIISYSLYLFHQPLISASHSCLVRLVPEASPAFKLVALLMTLAPIAALACASYLYLEKRSVAFVNWLASRLSIV